MTSRAHRSSIFAVLSYVLNFVVFIAGFSHDLAFKSVYKKILDKCAQMFKEKKNLN